MIAYMDALEFLESPDVNVPAVCVAYGDDSFLKRQALLELRNRVLAGEDGEFSLTVLPGPSTDLARAFDELATLSLFGAGRRLVIVEDADDFVSENRQALEEYVAAPRVQAVLALEVRTFAGTTRLAKLVAKTGLPIECKTPPEKEVFRWLLKWAPLRYKAKLDRPAAEQMLELVGLELGLLDQELAKLAAAAPGGHIDSKLVDELVGGWRVRTTWDMIDLALEGKVGPALNQLDRILLAGEEPIALFGQIGYSLRRLAAATRLVQQAEAEGRRPNLRQALEGAGVRSFVLAKSETQLRHIGRERGGKLYRWLLDADVAIKGARSSGDGPRIVLEQLLCRLAGASAPVRQ